MSESRSALGVTNKNLIDIGGVFKFQMWTIFLVILAMTPGLSSEPINPIKLTVLAIGACSSSLALISSTKILYARLGQKILASIAIFILLITISGISSQTSTHKLIYGEWGRNTGLLFYFCLTLIFLVSIIVSNPERSLNFYRCLIWAGLLNTTYMVVQALDLDPVKWEVNQTFGFTGNLNFASSLTSVYAILVTAWIIDKRGSWFNRTSLAISAVTGLIIIFRSGSLQGLIQFILGLICFWIFKDVHARKTKLITKFRGLIVSLVLLGTTLGIIATSFPNFFSGIFFQQTMGYRRDYWIAGLGMIKSNPLSGIGVDNYGNFYHQYRPESAAVDNYLRQSNTAHSIVLDIGSNYGILAVLFYISFLSYILFCIVKTLGSNSENTLLIGLGSIWISLQIQNFIGINQATTGVLTWFIGGTFVSLYRGRKNLDSRKVLIANKPNLNRAISKSSENLMSSSGFVRAMIGAVIGTILVAPLLYGDITFQKARNKQDFTTMTSVAGNSLIGNQTMMEFVVSDLVGRSQAEQGLAAAKRLVNLYPRSVYGWRVIASLKVTSEADRQWAMRQFELLDPYGFKYATQAIGN